MHNRKTYIYERDIEYNISDMIKMAKVIILRLIYESTEIYLESQISTPILLKIYLARLATLGENQN